jgi:hypothetical protein
LISHYHYSLPERCASPFSNCRIRLFERREEAIVGNSPFYHLKYDIIPVAKNTPIMAQSKLKTAKLSSFGFCLNTKQTRIEHIVAMNSPIPTDIRFSGAAHWPHPQKG